MKISVLSHNFPADCAAVRLLEAAGHTVRIADGDPRMGTGAEESVVLEAIGDADIVIAGLEPYTASVIEKAPNLKMISRCGIGYDAIDVEACRRKGVAVARALGAVEEAVAEHVMAYIMHFARRIDLQNDAMHDHRWIRPCPPGAKTRTLGLIGFGGIGKEIAKRAVPFGMKVVYFCRHPDPAWDAHYGVRYMPLDELLAQSDYVSMNVPLSDATRHMMNDETIARMKRGSYLINIARGPVCDENAIARALTSGHLAGAAVDVFAKEPCTNSPLADCPNAVLTCHTASSTVENLELMTVVAARNAADWVEGCCDPKKIVC